MKKILMILGSILLWQPLEVQGSDGRPWELTADQEATSDPKCLRPFQVLDMVKQKLAEPLPEEGMRVKPMVSIGRMSALDEHALTPTYARPIECRTIQKKYRMSLVEMRRLGYWARHLERSLQDLGPCHRRIERQVVRIESILENLQANDLAEFNDKNQLVTYDWTAPKIFLRDLTREGIDDEIQDDLQSVSMKTITVDGVSWDYANSPISLETSTSGRRVHLHIRRSMADICLSDPSIEIEIELGYRDGSGDESALRYRQVRLHLLRS